MSNNFCTEIAEFETLPTISAADCLSIIEGLEKEFHSLQPGFISTQLLQGSNNQWIMIQNWQSEAHAKDASKNLMQAKEAENFVRSLDPKSVRIRYFATAGKW